MSHFCAAAALLGANLCVNDTPIAAVEQSFIGHMAEHNLSYGTKEEYEFRFGIFTMKDLENTEINSNTENTFTVGHNQFSTWTDAEYKRLLSYKGPTELTGDFTELPAPTATSVDWRTKGNVNAVKNQGQCGSCWAFSATASIESHHQIASGKLLSLSEQQLVDCDSSSYGCQGGWQKNAMNYVKSHSQELETQYAYTARDGTCHAKSGSVSVRSVAQVQARSPSALMAAIAKGVVSVTVEADRSVFQRYTGGVLNSTQCGTQMDHAIAAVGYGNLNGQDYYIVRNSWGSGWGDRGYINIAAVPGVGICGIQQVSVWPTTN